MKRSAVSAVVGLMASALCTAHVQAQGHVHAGDFIVGVSGGPLPQLKLEGDPDILSGLEAIELPPIDPPSSGVFEGWVGQEPGFDHLVEPEPAEDFYPMNTGADLRLVGIDLDAALYVRAPAIGSPVVISPTPTLGSLRLGDELLHTHAIWHVDVLAPGYNPLQTVWSGTFKLADLGSTGYADSDPFTLTFTTVPEPTALVLLAVASLVSTGSARRRGRRV